MECIGQLDRSLVQADREGRLDDPRYIAQLPREHPARANENVFVFSMAAASLELLQLLQMIVTPAGIASVGAQIYHFPSGTTDLDTDECEPWCASPSLVALGEAGGHPGTVADHPTNAA
jgi:hypothetical protein